MVLEAQTAAIEGSGRVERVVLKDGRAYPAELVVMAAGIRPATALAESGGLAIGRGIKVDDALRRPAAPASTPSANAPSIAAPATAWSSRPTSRPRCSPAISPGLPARYEGSLSAASLKVSGVPVFSMGDFEGEGAETILLEDQDAAAYRKLVVRDGSPGGRGAVRRYRRRALVSRPDPPAGAPSPRSARSLAFGRALRGGRLMSAQDFTEEQRRYLEGFVSGVQARRAAQGLKPLGTEGGAGAAQPAGPDKEHLAAMARFEAAGKKLSPEEKAKRDEHPFDAYARFKAESAKGQFPKGIDNFRWRFHGLFYVAPTQNSYMCRLRIPNGILSHWQFAGVADLAEALRRRLRARDHARQSADSRHHAARAPSP